MKIFEAIYNEACAARLQEATVAQVANAIAKFTKSSIAKGGIDSAALQSLENLIQNTMMSEVGVEGDKSAKGINKAINHVIQNSTPEWSGGNPGALKAFFDRNKNRLGKILGAAINLGLTADAIRNDSEAAAAAGKGTMLNGAQALKAAQAQR
jgi:NAD(P)H-dependent FMN reductase